MGQAFSSKVQYGKESTHGTAVAATKMLPTILQPIQQDETPTYPREHSGIRADGVRSYTNGKLVKDSLKFDVAYFQLLPLLLSCGVKGDITPVEQTADQDDYQWDHVPTMDDSVSNDQDSVTLERGDTNYMVETEYCMFSRLKFKGTINQEGGDSTMSIEADYFGRQNTASTFTSLSPQANLTKINSKLARLYLDTTWAGVGSTELAHTLRAFDYEIITGLAPDFSGDGGLTFYEHSEDVMAIMASFTFEGNSNMSTIAAAKAAQTLQVARLNIPGPQIGSGENYLFQLDFSGTWQTIIPMASQSNGKNVWTAVLKGFYDLTGEKLLQASTIVNQSTI
jgi:hypothetical protein